MMAAQSKDEALRQLLDAIDRYQLLVCVQVGTACRNARAALAGAAPAASPPQEPWRDHVEQRLMTWRQRFVNLSGDQLALDDFMDKESLDDLIDFVCDEWAQPESKSVQKRLAIQRAPQAQPASTAELDFDDQHRTT
jgi:hypothetical protein